MFSILFFSCVWLFVTYWTAACQTILSLSLWFAQTHVHWVSDAIQPSHPLLAPSPSAFSRSQHQGLFQWTVSSKRWLKYWSLSISPSNEYSGLISFRINWFDLLAVQGLSRIFSSTSVQKHQFFGVQPSLWSNSHIHTLLPKNQSFDYVDLCQQNNVCFLICCLHSL